MDKRSTEKFNSFICRLPCYDANSSAKVSKLRFDAEQNRLH